ncbi:MAG: glutamine-hydrolyzing GMP synthase [Pseudomonadota bacterium]
MTDIHAQRILILDFGSQFTQLIARRVREAGVYCEIYACDVAAEHIESFGPNGIILSGGPESVTAENRYPLPDIVLELNVPILGVCYGMQLLANYFGAEVAAADHAEFGYATVRARGHSRLLVDIQDRVNDEGYGLLDVWMSHGDRVETLPEGFKLIASTGNAPIAGFANEEKNIYALQFHVEVTHTSQGAPIIERFVRDICQCDVTWKPQSIAAVCVERARQQIGESNVLLGLSGGVDSSVVAALLHRAVGDQLTCVFVDTGLLRHQEGDQVMNTFSESLGVRVIRVNAEAEFLSALAGVDDPEQKRKIIGGLFIEIFEREATAIKDVHFLAQGTIYPDVIESAGSATGKAHVIKSHHNVGGLPEHMNLQLVEPLRELFKDEVRLVGRELGLPAEMVDRHPFPGPGLGVRILGEVKKDFADTLRLADHIFIEELRRHDLYNKVSQAFAVFLPIKSVGVTGDGRRYAHVICLRCVETTDFMTAHWSRLPEDFLDLVSRRIINELDNVSRVVYDISGKPPATIEWE